ncbi:TPA: hypothetical protein ACVU4L_004759 [Vibrio parahaemolyticus]|nr:hypothetical protein [Vibrio parahaemolyticus]HBC3441179.1 hypothetical protein [Vibrio parahaemolyticus]HBC3826596.1 hypothetical protein [Vibrio parahaemolyticus]HBC3893429.1 hypothetical protein [Vibrio parahaemolyticus]
MERQSSRASFQQANRLLKQKIQPQKKPENDFHKPERFKIEVRKPSQKHTDINSKHPALAAFSSLATNALLRGEQRNTDAAAYHLNH